MFMYQKSCALVTRTDQNKQDWLEWYCENTAHTYPISLFGTSKRCRGSETSRLHKVRLETTGEIQCARLPGERGRYRQSQGQRLSRRVRADRSPGGMQVMTF